MRTLTLTRRFMSRQQIPLSGTPPFVDLHGLRCGRCALD